MSSARDQSRMYFEVELDPAVEVGSRRELTCHRPVMPGFIANRAWCHGW